MSANKTVIVIGATGGIGSVLSKSFFREGSNLVLVSRTEKNLRALAEGMESARVLIMPADASKKEDMERVFSSAKEKFGKVDVVIIAAGTWKQLSIDESPTVAVDLARFHFDSIFLPGFVVGFIAQKFFREQGSGLIVNISSHAALRPELAGNLTYGPMKAASRHFMLALEHELKRSGIQVCDIAPAIVNTPDAAHLLDTDEKKAKAVQPEAIAEWLIDHVDDEHIESTKLFDSEIVL